MRVVFMGTPQAAVLSLRSIADHVDVTAVYTRPDKPRGRGRHTAASPVKEAAEELELAVVQPKTLKDQAGALSDLAPDVIVVVAYGMLLPPDVLAVARLGCVNVHFSLLPRWRGAAPVEAAVLAGDEETGVTTMLMDEGMDTGPILLQERSPISVDDTAGTITHRLSELGAELLVRTMNALEQGSITPSPQPSEGATLAPKVTVAQAELDLSLGARELVRVVRAFNPDPGAYTWISGRRIKVWRAEAADGDGTPGTIAVAGPDVVEVQTGNGRLRLSEVQPEGKGHMTGAEYVRGYRLIVGDRVGRV